jgi:hypothetical protein
MPRDRALGSVQAVARCPRAQVAPGRRHWFRAPLESNLADAWLNQASAAVQVVFGG